MKRLTLFFSLFFICLVVSKADPVSRSQALNEAKAFLSTKGIEMKSSEATYRAPRKANAQDAESSYYYIFNVGNDQGFVIVSGDDRTEKILGYSDSGSFDEEDMPEPLKEWLQGYEREMESIVEVDASEIASFSPRKVAEKTKKTIAPLTTSKWAAGYPYNDKTPMVTGDGKTKHAPTGCVATAMAQLLYYYRADNVKKTLVALNSSFPAGTVIDWDNMLDDYLYKGYTTTQKNAVANLMFYCGTAIGSRYTYGATYANEYNVLTSLCKYFGYNDSMAYIDKHYYSEDDWENIIYEELVNYRPVFFGGGTDAARHLFLIDGYDCNGLFHVNWGWRGKYNGFFCLSVLNRLTPDCKGIQIVKSYTNEQAAVLYISPKSNNSVNTSNGILSAKVTSASGQIVTYEYENQSGISGSYLFGIGYLDSEGNAKLLKQYSSVATSLSSGSSGSKPLTGNYTFKASDFSNLGLSNGIYSVVPMYQLSGNSEWKICQYPKNSNTIVNYTGSTVTVSSKANLDLSATIEHYGNGMSGSEQKVRATIHNNSRDYGFNGNVYLFASTTTTKGDSQSSLSMYIGNNNEVTVELPFTPKTAGSYTIWISTDAKCSNVIGTSKVTIESETKGSLTLSVGYTSSDIVTYKSERTVWGNTCTLVFNGIKNETSYPIEATFTVWIRQFDSTTSTAYNSTEYTNYADNAEYYSYDVLVPANSSITIPVTFEGLKPDTKYDATIVYNGDTKKKVTAFVVRPGVTTWYADGTHTSVAPTDTVTVGADVVAVDITDAKTVKTIKPSTNKNILYYLGASQTVPSGLSGYNVVKGDVAEKVTLVDGKDFFVPKRFTAKSINYTVQPKEGVSRGNNNHWNAISLPFEVTSVKNTTDNVDIDWFHSDTDTGKNFWIRKFDKLDTSDNTVIFENAEKMLAYEPYIMNVPDDYWGKKWDLRGKKITFYGENAVLHHEANEGTNSSHYIFVGTTVKKTLAKAWFLNDAGDTFKYTTNNTIVPAFHAYFTLTKDYFNSFDASKASLRIKYSGDDDGTTGIMAPFAADEKEVSVYNLNGVKVATKKLNNGVLDMSDMPKGIYVVNGKKFIQY